MEKKKRETVEVLVTLTPEQIYAIYKLHPDEINFTRKLIEWDLSGRRRIDLKARMLQLDRDKLTVIPEDDDIPAFIVQSK